MKIFRLEEATALLPIIKPLLVEVTRRRRDYAIALLEAELALGFGAATSEGRDPVVMRREARELQEEINARIEAIQRHECIVKDIDLGLVGFSRTARRPAHQFVLEDGRSADRVLAHSRRRIRGSQAAVAQTRDLKSKENAETCL